MKSKAILFVLIFLFQLSTYSIDRDFLSSETNEKFHKINKDIFDLQGEVFEHGKNTKNKEMLIDINDLMVKSMFLLEHLDTLIFFHTVTKSDNFYLGLMTNKRIKDFKDNFGSINKSITLYLSYEKNNMTVFILTQFKLKTKETIRILDEYKPYKY